MDLVCDPSNGQQQDGAQSLWQHFIASRDEGLRSQLIDAYRPYARMHAARAYGRRIDGALEFDDYLQYALVGTLEAIDRYDPARGVKFETFASTRITGAILNGIAAASEVHEQMAARKRILSQRVGGLVADGMPVASTETVFAKLAEVAIGLAIGFALEETGMLGGAGDYPDNSYRGVELKQLRAQLRWALDELAPTQRRVVFGHYLQQQTFSEIAAGCGLSSGRVAQLHREALVALRRKLSARGAMDLLC